MDDRILTERAGDVITLRLNTPAAMNAIDAGMAEALHAGLVEASGQARAIVLAGHARAFCAGANLAGGRRPEGADMGERLESSFNPLMLAIKECAVPVVSAVRGAAAASGRRHRAVRMRSSRRSCR